MFHHQKTRRGSGVCCSSLNRFLLPESENTEEHDVVTDARPSLKCIYFIKCTSYSFTLKLRWLKWWSSGQIEQEGGTSGCADSFLCLTFDLWLSKSNQLLFDSTCVFVRRTEDMGRTDRQPENMIWYKPPTCLLSNNTHSYEALKFTHVQTDGRDQTNCDLFHFLRHHSTHIWL